MYSLWLCLRSLQLLPEWKQCTKRTHSVLSVFISKGVHNGFTLYHTSEPMWNQHNQLDDASHTVLSPDKLPDEATLPKSDPAEFPSDLAEGQAANIAQKQSQKKHAFRPKINPEDAIILLFPGQGNQFVGMGQQLLDMPGVKELYSKANDILRFDLLELCLNGPSEKLNQTVHCQPAVFVTSIAAVDKLKYTCSWVCSSYSSYHNKLSLWCTSLLKQFHWFFWLQFAEILWQVFFTFSYILSSEQILRPNYLNIT